jgi:hypothetical protein
LLRRFAAWLRRVLLRWLFPGVPLRDLAPGTYDDPEDEPDVGEVARCSCRPCTLRAAALLAPRWPHVRLAGDAYLRRRWRERDEW